MEIHAYQKLEAKTQKILSSLYYMEVVTKKK